ncbi:tyrosine-type recombinase/integrase [Streptomyces cadmiisoli]|uniref:tyrosine-type recombinase/integrase n=1 Tax=Streptomyces cadmiisoli TaxID=2184053 RepID=UPI00364D8CA0
MPLLFQRDIGTEHRAFTPTALRKLLINALAATGLTDAGGELLAFSPHDFRRTFVTDAIMNGLPPHIAQVLCGHRSLDTTMGYKAIYPAETIEARAFIARRRASRPSEEYRTPTEEEWDAFLTHFEKRKVSIGTCGRAFSSPCVHEHACLSELVQTAWRGRIAVESLKVVGRNIGTRQHPSVSRRGTAAVIEVAPPCTCAHFTSVQV